MDSTMLLWIVLEIYAQQCLRVLVPGFIRSSLEESQTVSQTGREHLNMSQ